MKQKLLSIILAICLVVNLSNSTESKAEDSGDWLVGGEIAAVWVLTGIVFMSRHICCVESNPNNACNKDNQDSTNCDVWRANDTFVLTFPNPE